MERQRLSGCGIGACLTGQHQCQWTSSGGPVSHWALPVDRGGQQLNREGGCGGGGCQEENWSEEAFTPSTAPLCSCQCPPQCVRLETLQLVSKALTSNIFDFIFLDFIAGSVGKNVLHFSVVEMKQQPLERQHGIAVY